MARTTVAQVNKALASKGHNAELMKDGDYYGFFGVDCSEWRTYKLRVTKVTDLTVDQWVAQYERLKLKHEAQFAIFDLPEGASTDDPRWRQGHEDGTKWSNPDSEDPVYVSGWCQGYAAKYGADRKKAVKQYRECHERHKNAWANSMKERYRY